MKHISSLLLAVLLLSYGSLHAADTGGLMNLQNVPLPQVLSLYHVMSGLDLVVNARVKKLNSTITLQTSSTLTKDESMKLIVQAFREQAGVVIAPLDHKHASVTFNDALPIKRPVKS